MEKRVEESVDLLIIGGGATGAGCLLEGARRGISVHLVEKGDFASGTTSASSRLIHGGIRYLENFHFGLVMESIRERHWIGEHFPHLVNPLPIHIPVYGWGKRSPLAARIGVTLYDLLAGDRKVGESSVLTGDKARSLIPGIYHDGLKGLFTFYDFQITMPERLVLENIEAAKKLGGRAENYMEAKEVTAGVENFLVRIRDLRKGTDLSLKARCVINAAGPWGDMVRQKIGFRGRLLRPTKGVHIEVPRLSDRAFFSETGGDGRLFFTLPFLGHTIIGTTDTDHSGTPDDALPTMDDVSYLIGGAERVFRDPSLTAEHIYSAYSGCRPLINVPGKKESEVPRKHRVTREGPGGRFISITGGKLTTYRKMAEDAVMAALPFLKGKAGRPSDYDFTCGRLKDGEAARFREHLEGSYRIGKEVADRLYSLYGMGADKLLSHAGKERGLVTPLFPSTNEIPLQVVHAFESESALTLEDVLLRRLLAGKSHKKGMEAESKIIPVLIQYLGKTEKEAKQMVEDTWETFERKFLMRRGCDGKGHL